MCMSDEDRSRSRGAAVWVEPNRSRGRSGPAGSGGACKTEGVGVQVTKEEVVQTLRRQSKGFQKTSSQYRGVTRHQKGKFEARCGAPADLFPALPDARCQSAACQQLEACAVRGLMPCVQDWTDGGQEVQVSTDFPIAYPAGPPHNCDQHCHAAVHGCSIHV